MLTAEDEKKIRKTIVEALSFQNLGNEVYRRLNDWESIGIDETEFEKYEYIISLATEYYIENDSQDMMIDLFMLLKFKKFDMEGVTVATPIEKQESDFFKKYNIIL